MNSQSKTRAQLFEEIKDLRQRLTDLKNELKGSSPVKSNIQQLAKFPSENPNPVLRISKSGYVLYFNKASSPLLRLWKIKKDQPIPGDWLKYVRKAHRSGEPQRTEAECGKKIFSLTFAPVLKSDFVNVYGLDITDLKKTAQELRVEKAFTENALDTQLDTFFVFDPISKKAIRWNGTFRKISGYSDEEITSMKAPDDWYSKDDLKKAAAATEKILKQGSGTLEMSLITKDGRSIPTEYSTSIIRDDRGNPRYFIAIGRDISERKQAEIVLKESEERFKGAFETAPIGMALISLDGQWIKVNPELRETIGYTEDELLAMNIRDIAHPDDIKRDIQSMKKIISGEIKIYQREERYSHKKGYTVWILLSMSLIRDSEGNPVHFIIQFKNITERRMAQEKLKEYSDNLERMVTQRTKKLEEESRKLGESQLALTYLLEDVNESREELEMTNRALEREIQIRESAEDEIKRYAIELESANRELESFSYSVSHDLRAPLRSINGFSQVLIEDYTDSLDGQALDYLQRVRRASQRMATLIDDLLKLSRVTRSEMRRENIDLTKLSREVFSDLKKSQPDRKVELIIEERMSAKVDGRLIRIMLQNLLGNAWKFTGKKQITRIKCGILKNTKNPTFFIRDNGTGFKMEYADKLFGPFQRLHSSSEFPGTGIGLATVQRIVHRHGGRIWGEGKPGKGATFYFTFHQVMGE